MVKPRYPKRKSTGSEREMADILALALLHNEAMVEQTVDEALEPNLPSKQHVINCLRRPDETPKPKPLSPASPLQLVTEPVVNTNRYDRLRRAKS
jgi:hypothetical protein